MHIPILINIIASAQIIKFEYNYQGTTMSSQQFRKLLQQFYIRVSTSQHADVYKKILSEQFDEVEVQPMHVLTITQQPSIKNLNLVKKENKKVQCLYRSTDFASVFLFGFLLNVLKHREKQFLKELQKRVMDNLDMFYGEKQSDDSIKYKFMFGGIFDFCEFILTKNYEYGQIQKLFKAFYGNTFERRGLKKNEKQKFLTQAQMILSFLLGKGGNFPSKKDLSEPNSDVYDLNNLEFCIIIQNMEENEEWTIGQGENRINIVKERGEYLVYEDQIETNQEQVEEISEAWMSILNQSLQIKKEQYEKTPKIFIDLNIAQISSPAKSMRSPKSMLKNGIKRTKLGDFF